jgi:hypothetical protein
MDALHPVRLKGPNDLRWVKCALDRLRPLIESDGATLQQRHEQRYLSHRYDLLFNYEASCDDPAEELQRRAELEAELAKTSPDDAPAVDLDGIHAEVAKDEEGRRWLGAIQRQRLRDQLHRDYLKYHDALSRHQFVAFGGSLTELDEPQPEVCTAHARHEHRELAAKPTRGSPDPDDGDHHHLRPCLACGLPIPEFACVRATKCTRLTHDECRMKWSRMRSRYGATKDEAVAARLAELARLEAEKADRLPEGATAAQIKAQINDLCRRRSEAYCAFDIAKAEELSDRIDERWEKFREVDAGERGVDREPSYVKAQRLDTLHPHGRVHLRSACKIDSGRKLVAA